MAAYLPQNSGSAALISAFTYDMVGLKRKRYVMALCMPVRPKSSNTWRSSSDMPCHTVMSRASAASKPA